MFSIMVSCGCGVQGSWAWRASNLFFSVIVIGWGCGLLLCFIFSFLSSRSSCESLSSPFKFSCFVFILFLITRFGGGLSFRVFCVAVLMLLSLIICCFSIFLLIPFFWRAYGGFRLLGFDFIPFFFYFYIVCRVVDVITIFSLFSTLFVFLFFFFFFALSLSTVHCIACRAQCLGLRLFIP